MPSSLESTGTIEMWVNPDSNLADFISFNWFNTTSLPVSGHVLHFNMNVSNELSIGGWASNPAEMYGLTSGATVTSGQ